MARDFIQIQTPCAKCWLHICVSSWMFSSFDSCFLFFVFRSNENERKWFQHKNPLWIFANLYYILVVIWLCFSFLMPIKYDNNEFSFLQTSDLVSFGLCFCFLFTLKTVDLNFGNFISILLDNNNQVVWLIIMKVFEVNWGKWFTVRSWWKYVNRRLRKLFQIWFQTTFEISFKLLKDFPIIVSSCKSVSNSKKTFHWTLNAGAVGNQ